MNMELNYLAQRLFNKNSFRDLNAVELDQLVGMFPYSSLLQFLYTKKLKEKNAFGYADSVAKAALYFSNPHWLNHQLNLAEGNGVPKITHVPPLTEPAEAETLTPTREKEAVVAVVEAGTIEVSPAEEEPEIENTPGHAEEVLESIAPAGPPPELNLEYPLEEPTGEMNGEETQNAEITAGKEYITGEQEAVQEESIPEPAPEPEPLFPQEGQETISQPQQQEPVEEVTVLPQEEDEINIPTAYMEDYPEVEKIAPREMNDIHSTQEPFENKTETGSVEESETEEPVEEDTSELIPFEPLYTVDYFASQGIRLSREEETGDKLGKSLKSFTEWLKSMKRLHPDKIPQRLDEQTERMVRNTAEHSNLEAEVITEAMAEVLTKQGLADKAIEVYQKLSLLIPGKSAYFAARIEELKAL